MLDGYLWLKSLHVIAIIAWMAGLLYLPRLFVYHTGAQPGTPQSETFKVMERRLLKAITTPAMIVSVVTGLWLAFLGGWWSEGWLHGKLLLVLGLLVSHHLMGRYVKAFAADANDKSSKFFRVFNEAPTLLMIGIVVLVIVKPILW
ncbi:protoporphyrinogen oxidase HemJ [Salinarimonas chemoclinalis]|uniref:protoporphyrinogen oxidase HemJ n=1 Tax=Salinarimonas chemoclinalis TaxID=3241599 RepID=UPI0035563079